VYGQADYQIIDKLTATAGLRWTHETKDIIVNYTNVAAHVTFTDAAMIALGYPVNLKVEKWTPKFGLQYQFDDHVMAYVSATSGFKSGGWNSRTNAAKFLVAFAPETVWSEEIGLRADWLDSRLRTNLTAFYADYKNRQIATSFPGTTTFVTTNAGDTPIKGLEAELSAVPIQGLQVFSTIGLMDSKLENLTPSAIASHLTTNTQVIQSPKWSVVVGSSYTTPLPRIDGSLVVSADASWKGLYYTDWPNLPNQRVKQPGLVDASIGYRSASEVWTVTLDCENCTHENWVRQILLDVAYPGDPFQWGLDLTYKFH